MSDVDEHLLTAAKLAAQARGDLDGDPALLEHAGVVDDDSNRSVMSFLAQDDDWTGSSLERACSQTFTTDRATRAVDAADASAMSHIVGVTETDYDASALTVSLDIVDELHFDGAPAFVTVAGNPNTGKTNTGNKLVEVVDHAGPVVDHVPDDLLVLSNQASWDRTDIVVTSMHDLMVAILENRTRDIAVYIDEASTHFDARTYNYEIASQWTPAAKRFAKVGVYCCILVIHSGKDLHPEAKRLTTLALWKESKKDVMPYGEWPADSDQPDDPLRSDPYTGFEKAVGYDPNDAAPWNWNLRPELFTQDLGWQGLLDALRDRGPQES